MRFLERILIAPHISRRVRYYPSFPIITNVRSNTTTYSETISLVLKVGSRGALPKDLVI